MRLAALPADWAARTASGAPHAPNQCRLARLFICMVLLTCMVLAVDQTSSERALVAAVLACLVPVCVPKPVLLDFI